MRIGPPSETSYTPPWRRGQGVIHRFPNVRDARPESQASSPAPDSAPPPPRDVRRVEPAAASDPEGPLLRLRHDALDESRIDLLRAYGQPEPGAGQLIDILM